MTDWILLRGLGRESAHWGDFISQMQQQFPDSQIHCLDLPGTGQHYQQKSPISLPKITRIVRAQAMEQGILNKPVRLLGLSLGGMVVWDWLKQFPEDASHAVMINSSFADLSPFWDRLYWHSYLNMLRIGAIRDIQQREAAILKLVCNRNHHQEVVDAWLQIQQQRPVSAKTIGRQLLAAGLYRAGKANPKQPVLIVSSPMDRLVSVECSRAVQQKWQLPMLAHPWAGHDLSVDDSPWLAEQLANWLRHDSQQQD
ncbi:alpha/beta hydrolase [Methylophaga lonarensis MPL]|uniref:Alpha/beta hydrolase n=1 Tax=Methylophaga lonarensis MPL TaxID=1286106 RepID=M7PR40_9GAMM|nr:alpha/beta hydrolase [Methylophaga lonarensis]EMR12909.1 alpha/beta hydrolase [Methylophaga lonarensis MPL]